MDQLGQLFKVEKNDVISITGSGGKTSLMYAMAKELSKKGSVLLTTSTKIYKPEDGFDKMYTDLETYKKPAYGEVVVMGTEVPGKNKLASLGYENLKALIDEFDYVLIEADGARRLPLKFWHDYEPVIYDFSTKVIGVLPIKPYGKLPDPSFIYNFMGFTNYLGEGVIGAATYNKLITYKGGLFRDYTGKKFVYINQVEDENDFINMDAIKEKYTSAAYLRYGSIKKGDYYEY